MLNRHICVKCWKENTNIPLKEIEEGIWKEWGGGVYTCCPVKFTGENDLNIADAVKVDEKPPKWCKYYLEQIVF